MSALLSSLSYLQQLPPMEAFDLAVTGVTGMMLTMSFQQVPLFTMLMKGEIGKFQLKLEEVCSSSSLFEHLSVTLAGGNNIFHTLAELAAPKPPPPGSSYGKKAPSMRELFKRASRMASSSSPPHHLDPFQQSSSDEGEGESESDMPLKCIRLMSKEVQKQPHLFLPLLQARSVSHPQGVGPHAHSEVKVHHMYICR